MYVLYTFSCLYDQAVFYSSEELSEMGRVIDVEDLVRKPQIHILARCSSSDEDTLAYSSERSCIDCLGTPVKTSTGIECNDVLRFFHADMPATAAESGQQYGGHFPCGSCGAQANMFSDLAFNLRKPIRSLDDCLSLFYKGAYASNSTCRPFATLTREELAHELAVRNLNSLGNKKELARRLQHEIGGIQRLPSLLYKTEAKSMSEIGLNQYEMALSEPLHDYSNHIKNLFQEIPAHLSKDGKEVFRTSIDAIFQNKQTLRACDYRDAAVLLPQVLRQDANKPHIPQKFLDILDTLCEMGNILYSREAKRTTQSVLHLYLKHWLQLRQIFPTAQKLTNRKLWGYCSHALLTHAPLQYRVIALRQLYAEDEERMFAALKDITRRTSNQRSGYTEYNAIIRMEEERKQGKIKSHSSVISAHATLSLATTQSNTVISKGSMQSNSHHWQAMLESISDYVVEGPNAWWRRLSNGNIEFFDIKAPGDIPDKPCYTHFRSSTSNSIQTYLQEMWQNCLQRNVQLPLETLHHYNNPECDASSSDTCICVICGEDQCICNIEELTCGESSDFFYEQESNSIIHVDDTETLSITECANDLFGEQDISETVASASTASQIQYAFQTKAGIALSKLYGEDDADAIKLDNMMLRKTPTQGF